MANFYAQYPSSSGGSANPSIGVNGATAPTSSTEVGGIGPDGNLHPVSTDNSGVLNVNTTPASGSVQHVIVDSSALPTGASTSSLQNTTNSTLGSILLDLTNGTQITQVTGNVTVVQPTGTNLHAVVDSSALPTGAATSALQVSGNTLLTTIASNQTNGTQVTAINNFPATQPVSGTVTVTQSTAANLNATVTGSVSVSNFPATQPVSGTVTANAGTGTFAVSAASLPLPTGAATSALQTSTQGTVAAGTAATNSTLTGAVFNTSAPTLTNGQQAALQATSTGALIVSASAGTSSTSTITSVAGSATSVSILASNTARKGMMVFNDSTATLYLKFGTTASTTSYSVQIASNGYFEMPNPTVYIGAMDGIWSAANGNARITELT